MLESYCYDENCFVTLTYDEEHNDGQLHGEHLRDFLKRFREILRVRHERRFRFFAVGEYGDASARPHYHLSLFNAGVRDAERIQSAWPFGYSSTYEFNPFTAQYVAGYVANKLTKEPLVGKVPEFQRQSCGTKEEPGGLGVPALPVFAEAIWSEAGQDQFLVEGDVPAFFQVGNRKWPFGRYLRQKLRDIVGVDRDYQENAKARWVLETSVELSAVLQTTLKDEALATISKVVERQNAQRLLQIEVKERLRRTRKRNLVI